MVAHRLPTLPINIFQNIWAAYMGRAGGESAYSNGHNRDDIFCRTEDVWSQDSTPSHNRYGFNAVANILYNYSSFRYVIRILGTMSYFSNPTLSKTYKFNTHRRSARNGCNDESDRIVVSVGGVCLLDFEGQTLKTCFNSHYNRWNYLRTRHPSWQIRNYREFGGFTIATTNGGIHFWMGNNPSASGGFIPDDFYISKENKSIMRNMTEIEKDR